MEIIWIFVSMCTMFQIKTNPKDHKYKQMQLGIFKYIADNKIAISKKLKKFK